MRPYRKYPDDGWLWAARIIAVLSLATLALAWASEARAGIRHHLWLPVHLDRQTQISPDWVYERYPTVSIGANQPWYTSRHRSVYIKLTRTDTDSLPEHAYSHDEHGNRVKDAVHKTLWVGNPASQAWRAHVRSLCRYAHTILAADSCFGDGVGLASYYRMTARPHTSDGQPISRAAWVDRIVGMLRSFPSELRVVANTAGWESPEVAAAAWARSVEGNPTTPSRYEQTMVGSRAWILAYTSGAERLAKFLLYAGPEDRYAYWARDRRDPVAWPRAFRLRIGAPGLKKARTRPSGVVYRQYTRGLALWNPTDGVRSFRLAQAYRRPDGRTVTGQLRLAAGAAVVLEEARP